VSIHLREELDDQPLTLSKTKGRPMSGPKRKSVTVTIAVISSNHLVRLGLQQIIGTTHHIRLVGYAKNGVQADELIAREQPKVILIDMEPEIDVAGLIAKLKQNAPSSKIVLLSSFDEKERIREAFLLGVDGIVLKIQPPAVLIAVIESLSHAATEPTGGQGGGVTPFPSSVSLPPFGDTEPSALKWPGALTEREREVIGLIGQGLSNKDIADRLCISGITVRHHLTNIFDKLGVTTRQKLLIRAHQYGLVELTASA
jgi:DNA-binding NarL/FixJ family response regulator